jgi:hypothetical protein
VQLQERESMPKQTYPKYLDGTSDANASSRVEVMFQVHEIRSQGHVLLAGSASMKRSSNMQYEGQNIAKSQLTFTCGPSDSCITCLHAMYVPGAAHHPLSASSSSELQNRDQKRSVHPSLVHG